MSKTSLVFPSSLLLATTIFGFISLACAQDMFFYGEIKCYQCVGTATNSSCSDPFSQSEQSLKSVEEISCDRGACLKRRYKGKDNSAMIMRTCTNKLDFQLPLVNNVCQDESDGFGYLCMCGKSLCNSTGSVSPCGLLLVVLILASLATCKY